MFVPPGLYLIYFVNKLSKLFRWPVVLVRQVSQSSSEGAAVKNAIRQFVNIEWMVSFALIVTIGQARADADRQSDDSVPTVKAINLDEKQVLGKWNAHVFVVDRRPVVTIQSCSLGKVKGIYVGQMGSFPLSGCYDATSGHVDLSVDFSSSPLVRLRGLSTVTAHLNGQLSGSTIKGIASFPEFKDKQFKWEAIRDSSEHLPGTF